MARGRHTGRKSNAGIIMAIASASVAAVAAFGAIGYLIWWAIGHNEPIDPVTLCPKAGIRAQTVLLVDTTDEFAEVTRSDVLSKLDDVIAEIPKGGLLDIRVLNENPGAIGRISSLCNPGDGVDAANPELARRRWNDAFVGPVHDALEGAIGGTEQRFSPILAAVQQIAAERLSSKAGQALPTRIVVVSDLIEHTEYYSHFRDGLDFSSYEQMVGARYLTDLAGADVDFWLVQRDRPSIDRTALAEFWLRWADASKGRGHVVRLMGMD